MKFAVKQQDGTLTGVLYETVPPHVLAHHAGQGEALVPVAGLNNTGTDDAPVWQEAEVPETGRASFVADVIDAHVDAMARALKYNSAASLASYADSSVPEWRAEAQTFIAWRDQCWQAAIAMLNDVEASGKAPSAEEVIEGLPGWNDA